MVSLERCCGSYSTFNHIFDKLFVSNKTKDVILKVFNLIKIIDQSKTLVKHLF